MKYQVLTECDFFHNNPIRSFQTGVLFPSLERLLETEFKYEVMLPIREREMSYKELVQGILDERYTGFVTLVGGEESFDPLNYASYFGFCIQKYKPTIDEINWEEIVARGDESKTSKEKVEAWLKKKQARILNSTTFHSTETISTTYLKFLIENRGFKNFRIIHFMYYNFRTYQRDFLLPLLDVRHKAKLENNTVLSNAVKLILNSNYGYNALNSTKYSKTILCLEGTIKKFLVYKNCCKSKKILNYSMIGIIRQQSKTKTQRPSKYVPLYSLTYKDTACKIKNNTALAAGILSNAKRVFLNLALHLMNHIDLRYASICYIDTDSIYFSMTHDSIDNCILESKKKSWAMLESEVFANENGPYSCHGKLKNEGLFTKGYFRTEKAYRLLNPYSRVQKRIISLDSFTRCKSITASHAAMLKDLFFTGMVDANLVNYRTSLRPTSSYQIAVRQDRRKFQESINIKRRSWGVNTFPIHAKFFEKISSTAQ